jgi:hypothetical protein
MRNKCIIIIIIIIIISSFACDINVNMNMNVHEHGMNGHGRLHGQADTSRHFNLHDIGNGIYRLYFYGTYFYRAQKIKIIQWTDLYTNRGLQVGITAKL